MSFRYATADGTAKAGSDYVAETGMVTFLAGQTFATIDRLYGDAGSDQVFGEGGNDELFGGVGNDVLDGGDGADELTGGSGRDQLSGRAGNDVVHGDADADKIFGDAGADRLFGDAGNDTISGGADGDRIVGGLGRGQLTGGAGGDAFAFAGVADSRTTVALRDVIRDFDARFDTIDLSAMDANTTRTGNQAFRFIDDDAFSGVAGQLRFTNGLLFADVDGNRTTDFAVQLLGSQDLSASDFVL